MSKPFAESCEQNKWPILEVLQAEFGDIETVFEIGSGTGQHAVFFSQQLPHLRWQTSDRGENLLGIRQWLLDLDEAQRLSPYELDVAMADHWPEQQFDAVFSANAVHIMGWEEVQALFAGLGKLLGPGEYTSESNARFDGWLKQRDPKSGIRNFEDLDALAKAQGLRLAQDYPMPANNRILVWVMGA